MNAVDVVMKLERSNNNKVLFKADKDQNPDVVIDNVYVDKKAFEGSDPPAVITVTIAS